MWKRCLPWLAIGSVALVLGLFAYLLPADPRLAAQEAKGKDKDKAPPPAQPQPQPGVKVAASKVSNVTVYPLSALVTREVDVPAGAGIVELTVSPLPPATIATSLYSEGVDGV